jgi:hypothetical protein
MVERLRPATPCLAIAEASTRALTSRRVLDLVADELDRLHGQIAGRFSQASWCLMCSPSSGAGTATQVPDGLALSFRTGITLRHVRPAGDRRASPPFCTGAVLWCDLLEARGSVPVAALGCLWPVGGGFCGWGWVVLVGWAARGGGP